METACPNTIFHHVIFIEKFMLADIPYIIPYRCQPRRRPHLMYAPQRWQSELLFEPGIRTHLGTRLTDSTQLRCTGTAGASTDPFGFPWKGGGGAAALGIFRARLACCLGLRGR